MKKIVFVSKLFISLSFYLPVANQAIQRGYVVNETSFQYPIYSNPYNEMIYYDYRDSNYDPFNGYSISTYNHDYYNPNYAYTLHARCKNRNKYGFNSDAYLNRRYDNSTNFSSGISSYQGTSTGPGPNGGYPGTPRGIYKTRYIPNEF